VLALLVSQVLTFAQWCEKADVVQLAELFYAHVVGLCNRLDALSAGDGVPLEVLIALGYGLVTL
jgi:hypothetical protein